jgi:2-polyprenyl-3-methyl-5-hydroxy-6-metoxy-1,4-benzoquinol methylase
MNPQPTWEELQPYYPSDYPPYDPSHSLFRLDEEEVALTRERGEYRHFQISEGQRILDVGGGGGYFLRLAARLGAVVEGVEPNPIGADRARASGLTIFTGTVEDYARMNQGRTFDLITANHVLEHTPTPVATLEAMKQLLARQGIIWIAVPNADCYFYRKLKGTWYNADLPRHLMQFTPTSLQKAGERAGLVTDAMETSSFSPSVGHSIRQILRYQFLIPKRLTNPMTWLFDSFLAPRVAARMDRNTRGDAILIRFRRADERPSLADSINGLKSSRPGEVRSTSTSLLDQK